MKERHDRVVSISQHGGIWTDEGYEGNIVEELDLHRKMLSELKRKLDELDKFVDKLCEDVYEH